MNRSTLYNAQTPIADRGERLTAIAYPRFAIQAKDRSGKDTWITVSEHHTKTQAKAKRVRWIKKWKPELI